MSKRKLVYAAGIGVFVLVVALAIYFINRPAETNEPLIEGSLPPISEEPLPPAEETETVRPEITLAPYPTLDAPVFSHSPGFYSEPFYLNITAEQGDIRFTLDGSIPTLSSELFTDALQVRSMEESPMSTQGVGRAYEHMGGWQSNFVPNLFYNGMIIRAAVFDENGDFSETTTSSFFVEHNGRGVFNTRVLSLVMEPDHFIHRTQGMYRNWDRELWPAQEDVDSEDGPRHIVHAEMFDPNGELMFSQHVNAWVFGNWSRRHPKRSFRLNFSQGDGDIINMPDFMPNTRKHFYEPLEFVSNFRHLNARVSDYGSTGIRDSLVHLLSVPLRPTVQNSTYGAVFINGEFWGMYCLRAHRHSHLLSEMFGISSGNIQLREFTEWELYEPHFAGRDFSRHEDYQDLKNYVDMDDFIDYFIIGYHFENWDWISNNFEFWRSTELVPEVHGGDTRWRFVVQDFDNGINHPENDMMKFFTTTESDGGSIPMLGWNFGDSQRRPDWAVEMIRNLFNNEEFRNTLVARYSTYTGTVFNPSRANAIIDEMVAERIDTIGFDLYRWRFHGATNPTNGISSWLGNGSWNWTGTIDCIRYTLENRSKHSIRHILNYFNGDGNSPLSLGLDNELTNIRWMTDSSMGWFDISGAQIRADLFAQDNFNNYDFSIGDFNAEYMRGLPITVTARPLDGYEFSRFEVTGAINGVFTENPMTFAPPSGRNNSITVTAIFN